MEIDNSIKEKLKDLEQNVTKTESKVIELKPKKDKLGRAYATGRRKSSSARAWIKPGSGKIIVNNKVFEEYFNRAILRIEITQPFAVTNNNNKFDVYTTVKGSGHSGQAGAIKLAIARALVNFDPNNRSLLKAQGLLTRDSRIVERKKYGQRKARKKFQFSKR